LIRLLRVLRAARLINAVAKTLNIIIEKVYIYIMIIIMLIVIIINQGICEASKIYKDSCS